MSEQTKTTLEQFNDRVALVVTDLNGFRSAIANDEITEADFGDQLRELFAKLRIVEQAVSQLGDVFWQH